jgi:hypothetical protein
VVTTTVTPQGGLEIGGTAPVAFVGGGAVDSDAVVEWDFDNDGDFDEPEENVTGFFVAGEAMTGRDFPSQLTGRAGPGQLKLTFRNDDDRFSYFNADSPLNQDGNSLRIGRKIRVRTAEAVAADPVLLVRDRFNRPDGTMGQAETGQTWSPNGYAVQGNRVIATVDANILREAIISATPSNQDVYYIQATIGQLTAQNNTHAGLLARRQGVNDHVFARLTVAGRFLELGEVVAGTETVLATTPDPGAGRSIAWPGITIGLKDGPGDEITAYLNGVPVLSAATSVTDSAKRIVGLVYLWNNLFFAAAAPTFDDFYVFDDVVTETEGILWTGDITSVRPRAPVSRDKTAEVTAEGRLAHAALPDVVSPRAVFGAPTGILVGDVLAKANLLHPPGPIAEGLVTTGPVGVDDGKALDLARRFEDVEAGFLHETPEGAIGFEDRFARAGAVVVAGFSDAPGAQFSYSDLSPLDQRRDIVNRVTAGVAPDLPDGISVTTDGNSTAFNVTNHVDVDIPAISAGTLVVVFIASTVGAPGQGWNVPIWWDVHRKFGTQDDDTIRTRVYSHATGVAEAPQTIRFYTAPTNVGGAWVAHVYVIENWFDAASRGVGLTGDIEFTPGDRPPPFVPGWGRVPAIFIAVNAALTSVSGGSVNADTRRAPEGYSNTQLDFTNGATNGFDVALHTAYRFTVDESDHPTTFGGFEGFVFNESAVFAVRGFNGPHVVLPTIQNPSQFEASPGRFVTVDDVASQDELRTIRSLPTPPNLFATEADAEGYADAILATYSDDRPIFSITYVANKSAGYRAQALRRRVGDKIRLIAEHSTGMGVNGDYFIESVGHRWSKGGTLWEVTYDLSPA